MNRLAATPNAVRDRDNNVIEDPGSGTGAVDTDHVPGLPAAWPMEAPMSAMSTALRGTLMVWISSFPPAVWTSTDHCDGRPDEPVANSNPEKEAFMLDMVWIPSKNEKARGDTAVNGMLSPIGLDNVTVPVTLSLVV